MPVSLASVPPPVPGPKTRTAPFLEVLPSKTRIMGPRHLNPCRDGPLPPPPQDPGHWQAVTSVTVCPLVSLPSKTGIVGPRHHRDPGRNGPTPPALRATARPGRPE